MVPSSTDGLVRTTGLNPDGSRAREAERAHLQQRVEALESELAESRDELEKVREERDKARAESAKLREELEATRAELAERERELERAEQWTTFLESDLQDQRERVEELQHRVEALESRSLLDWLRAWL